MGRSYVVHNGTTMKNSLAKSSYFLLFCWIILYSSIKEKCSNVRAPNQWKLQFSFCCSNMLFWFLDYWKAHLETIIGVKKKRDTFPLCFLFLIQKIQFWIASQFKNMTSMRMHHSRKSFFVILSFLEIFLRLMLWHSRCLICVMVWDRS
jgi:hypothetical protein